MKKERVFWGVFFILAAALLIVGRMDFLAEFSVFKLVAGVALLACLIKGVMYRSVTGIAFTLAIACIIFDNELGLQAITPWPVLAAATLVSIGFGFIFPNRHRRFYEEHIRESNYHYDETVDYSDGGRNEYTTVFGSGIKYVNDEDLKNVHLSSVFGHMKVYFDNAVIKDEATLKLETVFGGIELFVPRHWNVVIDTTTVFGGASAKNQNENTTGSPTLYVKGEAVFGGVSIIYV